MDNDTSTSINKDDHDQQQIAVAGAVAGGDDESATDDDDDDDDALRREKQQQQDMENIAKKVAASSITTNDDDRGTTATTILGKKKKKEETEMQTQKNNSRTTGSKGYVHIYTGNGKGKTTAAFGLAVRALMAGKKVFIGQFVKSMKYHETKLEEFLPSGTLQIKQFGNGCFIYHNEPTQDDKKMAMEGLAEIERLLAVTATTTTIATADANNNHTSYYDMVILDEVTIAIRYKLLKIKDVVRVIRDRNPTIEIVVTGRECADMEQLIEIGDVVTEMKAIKHYFNDQGVLARDGIER